LFSGANNFFETTSQFRFFAFYCFWAQWFRSFSKTMCMCDSSFALSDIFFLSRVQCRGMIRSVADIMVGKRIYKPT